MSDIENAIRKALLNSDATDPARRRQIYESAWNGHEHFLINEVGFNEEERTRRRDALSQILVKIEREYRDAPSAASFSAPHAPAPDFPDLPMLDLPIDDAPYATGPEEELHIGLEPLAGADQDTKRRKAKKRARFPLLALYLVLLVVGCFVLWSFYNSIIGPVRDVPKSAENPHNQVEATPLRLADDVLQDGFSRVFTPQDVSSIAVSGNAFAQIHHGGDESYVRIRANGADDAAIIQIGTGALYPLRGKNATIDIIARSANDQPGQLTITCDFGGEGGCARMRFEVPATRESLLFNVAVPELLAGDGKLRITSDLLGEGHEVDIFGVFIRPAE